PAAASNAASSPAPDAAPAGAPHAASNAAPNAAPDGTRGAAARASTRLLIAGVAVPGLILLALLGFSTLRASQISAPSSLAPLRITVTAHMWWWEARYYDASSGREAVVANELHIPASVPVYLALTSADVIHTFWLPSLSGKVDMLPGRLHGLTLRADKTGTYRGQCAEFCGAQHANMALHLTVHPAPEFADWFANQATPAAASRIDQGRQAFVQARCVSCHAVRGLDEQPPPDAPKAPDLTHVGSRTTIAAGALPMNRGTLAAWIADPQAIKPGARMPAATVSAEQVEAIADWLESLK
ncbi:MAG TPA: c-type cytochrome, partial [Pseudoduganella sp.]